MAHDEQRRRRPDDGRRDPAGPSSGRRGALVALAGPHAAAAPASAAPSGPGAEVGTARESAAASERGVECVADLR